MNFSVLMSVYKNAIASELKESLMSIENQTLKPTELVLIEDGPVPLSVQNVILNFIERCSFNVRVKKLPKNKGLGNALSVGLKLVSYELVARVDGDDICATDRFRQQIDVFKEKPDVSIVGSNVDEFIGTIDNVVGSRVVPENENEILDFARMRSPFNHPTVMFKKSVVLASGNYQSKFPLFEDYSLWVRLLDSGYIGYNIQDPLVKMRVGTGMYTRRGGVKYLRSYYRFRRGAY
ncbi:glycosyltransferase, partial [Furfurilactobacillus siliginis]